ncbi:MAG: hypothetical protein CVV60_02140 [Tenericutes bacterium HGW-Tenericutes-5]|nr:MAG: hypothetical protein CVV60_02140 [Tenericutes bacterium HGW-Tenericutes-5]
MKKKYFVFPETQYYREYLETKHFVGQNALVIMAITSMMFLTAIYMYFSSYEVLPIIGFVIGYLVVLLFNFATIAYSKEHYYYLKLNKYITSISLFTLILTMIIYFKSPSFIPLIFVAYAVSAIYKDTKVLIATTVYFIFAVLMLIFNFKYIFEFQNAIVIKNLAIGFFLILFLLILLSSSFIIINEKTFFYNNIAFAKEKEYRNLDLILEFKSKLKTNSLVNRDYYQETKKILEEFSKKIEIDDVFSEKIDVLEKLESGIDKQKILKEHPLFNQTDLERLEKLLVYKTSMLSKLILKIKNSSTKKYKTREIFSSTHFQSFNKQSDSIEIKILCFVVYFVALKRGLSGMKPLTNQELFDTFINTDLYYFIDPKVIKIYRDNADVFNTIVDEVFGQVKKNG